jgi:hypothetical protein
MIAALLSIFLLNGCAGMGTSKDSSEAEIPSGLSRNDPYFPTKFNDFEVPGELKEERKKSMFINTSSFTGGILLFTGRVEVNSLTDFFVNSMQKNGWKLTGEVRYENIMLAFSKPNKNCMLTIYEGEYGSKTQVYVYITEDLQVGSGMEQNLR